MAYGDEIFKEHGHKILEMNREGVDIAGFAGSRFWLVDLIPPRMYSTLSTMLRISLQFLVQYIPAWFPGATFQRIAERSRVVSDYIRYEPWKLVLDRVRPSLRPYPIVDFDSYTQLRRPEGYEDCLATRLIEKVGPEGTVRDTIAFMHFGVSTSFYSKFIKKT